MNDRAAVSVADRTLVATRIFDAEPSAVWQAWADPARLRQWWGPKGFANTISEFDFRPGGHWRLIMHGPDGTDYDNHWLFVEITPFERIVADHLNAPKFRLTASFEDLRGRTRIVFSQLFDTAETCAAVRPRAEPGNRDNLERLADHLPLWTDDLREATFTRVLDAPLEEAFKAWTDPERLKRWWGPKGFENPVCEFNASVGGKIFIVMRAPDGAEYPMRGEVKEIVVNERLAFSNRAVDAEGRTIIDGFTTVTFLRHQDKTRVTVVSRAQALVAAARRNLSGMDAGWSQSLDRFVELLRQV